MNDPFDEIVATIESWLAAEFPFRRRLASGRQRRRMIAAVITSVPRLDDPAGRPILGFHKEQIYERAIDAYERGSRLTPLIVVLLQVAQILIPIIIDLILRWLSSNNETWPSGALSGARSCLRTGG